MKIFIKDMWPGEPPGYAKQKFLNLTLWCEFVRECLFVSFCLSVLLSFFFISVRILHVHELTAKNKHKNRIFACSVSKLINVFFLCLRSDDVWCLMSVCVTKSPLKFVIFWCLMYFDVYNDDWSLDLENPRLRRKYFENCFLKIFCRVW